MQIYELTRPRKVNEGFASALGTQLITKALGVNPLDQSGPTQSREQGIQSMINSPAAKTLATTMQAAWAQTVKNFLANAKDSMGNPATSLQNVTTPSTSALQPELRAMINKMIAGRGSSGFDYENLASTVEDPVIKKGLQKIVAKLNQYSSAIFDATVMGIDPKKLSLDWQQLVGDGILPAQNARAYDRGTARKTADLRWQGPGENDFIINLGGGWVKFDPKNREHAAVAEKMRPK